MTTIRRLAWAAVLGAAAFALAALVGASRYGYRNNGDFSKYNRSFVAGPVGEVLPRPRDPQERAERFRTHGWRRYWTLREDGPAPAAVRGTGTTPWLWWFGRAVHGIARPGPTLDLTYLGLLPRILTFAVVLALAGAVARRAVELRAPILLLAVVPWTLALTASSMTAFFNSFFREAGTFVFAALFVAALALAPRMGRARAVAALLGSGALLVASAPAHGPLAAIVALAALDVARPLRHTGRGSRLPAAALAFAVTAILALGIWRVTAFDRKLPHAAAFDSLFVGVLPLSQAPAEHLARLGFPTDSRELLGLSSAEEASRIWRAHHGAGLTHKQVLDVILHEPGLVPRMVLSATRTMNSTSIRGRNLWAADDPGPHGEAGWNSWGEVQARYFPRGVGYLVWLALALVAGLMTRSSADPMFAATGRLVALTAAASAVDLAVNFLGDGPMGPWRHMAGANFLLGASLAGMVWLLLEGWARRRAAPAAAGPDGS